MWGGERNWHLEEYSCISSNQPPGLGRTQGWGFWADMSPVDLGSILHLGAFFIENTIHSDIFQ